MRVWCGIDPGKKGGYAFIKENEDGTQNVSVHIWDDCNFVNDLNDLIAWAGRRNGSIVCAVEKVGAMPGQGVTSMFNFGKSAGYIEGVLTALKVPYQLVPPQKWKKTFSLSNDKKQSIETCKRLFPNVDLRATQRCRTDSDGKAESLLLAEYARRNL